MASGKDSGEAVAGSGSVALTGEIGFVQARDLHAQLLQLRESADVVIDASSVERLSAAAVMVLMSFLNARAEMQPPAAVLNPSGAFVDAFSELGLFGSLMRMEFRT